jgi:hypothetical protein
LQILTGHYIIENMSDIENGSGNDDRSASWGFLEDMASIGRLGMVLGDVEGSTPAPEEEIQPEDNSAQE